MNARLTVIRDLFLLLGLCTTVYCYRTLRSNASNGNTPACLDTSYTSEQPSLKLWTAGQALREPLEKTIELIHNMAVKTREGKQKTIEQFYQKAIELQEEYCKTSPSLMLLGPIGAAAMVLKENKIYKKLIELLQDITEYVEKNEHLEVCDCSEIMSLLSSLLLIEDQLL